MVDPGASVGLLDASNKFTEATATVPLSPTGVCDQGAVLPYAPDMQATVYGIYVHLYLPEWTDRRIYDRLQRRLSDRGHNS